MTKAAPRTPVRRRKGLRKTLKRFTPFYVMMSFGIVYLLINNYLPMAGIVLAFKRINYAQGLFASPWVGFKNFRFLFRTTDALLITRNTLLYNATFILLQVLIPVMIAIFLNEVRSRRLTKLYQTSILFPHLVSMVVVSYMVYGFLSSTSGFINNGVLIPLGREPISWYATKTYWPFILVLVQVWKSFGYYTIIYYATIVGVDRGYYEAAVLDGAGAWQQVRYITLPALKSTIITMALLSIGRIFYSDFGLFYQVPMNSGPLLDVTNTIDTYVYRGLFELNDIGKASAAGVYQSVLGFVLILVSNAVTRRVSREDALF